MLVARLYHHKTFKVHTGQSLILLCMHFLLPRPHDLCSEFRHRDLSYASCQCQMTTLRSVRGGSTRTVVLSSSVGADMRSLPWETSLRRFPCLQRAQQDGPLWLFSRARGRIAWRRVGADDVGPHASMPNEDRQTRDHWTVRAAQLPSSRLGMKRGN